MARTPKPKRDDPEQSKRFIEIAREIGVDESEGAFERAFHKVARTSNSSKSDVAPQARIGRKPNGNN